MRRRITVSYGRRIDQGAVFIQPGDRVAVLRGSEGRLVGRVAGHCCNFRCPACEGIGVFSCRFLGGIRMCRYYAILYARGVDHGVIIIQPGDRVAVLRGSECRLVSRVAGHCYNLGRPACEGVGVFSCRFLGGIRMCRYYAVSYGRCVDQGVIIIQPGNRVAVCFEMSNISSVGPESLICCSVVG